jgi:hypothetical protein
MLEHEHDDPLATTNIVLVYNKINKNVLVYKKLILTRERILTVKLTTVELNVM